MEGHKIEGTVALVTGANRGIGRAITEALLDGGAKRVYGGARKPESLDELVEASDGRLVPVRLDVTDAEQVSAAVDATGDLRMLVNNAGVALVPDLTAADAVDKARGEMDVNYFAPLELCRRLAPALAGGGAIVNIASVGGLTNFPFYPTYSASKAAAHSLTQGLRMLLAPQGTSVFGVYPGPVDTDMARGLDFDKATPRDVADAILAGVAGGHEEIFPDPFAEQFGQQFEASPKASERQVAAMAAEG